MTVGAKAQSLINLENIGVRVPPHITVDKALQANFVSINKLTPDLLEAQNSLKKGCKLPPELGKIWQSVSRQFAEFSNVGIVRSSAIIEDGEKLSFAGMFSSLPFSLNDPGSFYRAVIAVWLSPFKPEVKKYLQMMKQSKAIEILSECMGLLIQPLLPPQSSGVLFSRDPSNQSDLATVRSVYGLGEMLNTLGQTYSAFKEHDNNLILEKHTSLPWVLYPDGSAPYREHGDKLLTPWGELTIISNYSNYIVNARMPLNKSIQPCLTPAHRKELLQVMNQAIKLYKGRVFELEWLFHKEKLYTVQARLITATKTSSNTNQTGFYPIVAGDMEGTIKLWQPGNNLKDYYGAILLTSQLSYDLIAIMDKVSGIITASGDSHSHLAIICRELKVPVYCTNNLNMFPVGSLGILKDNEWSTEEKYSCS